MQDFNIRAHWEKVYESKDANQVSWFQTQPVTSLELIANAGLDLSDPIIDVGAGASTLVDHLLERGYRKLSVLDISKAALAQSRKRLGTSADAVSWILSDVTAFSPDDRYSLWHDRAVFHFLTDAQDRQRYVQVLKAALRVGGHLVIASFAIGGPEQCSGLPIVQYNAEKLKSELGTEFTLIEERAEEHVTPAQTVQKFIYFHFERVTASAT